MKILAVDSSAGPASCAVLENGRVLASSFANTGLTHSQTLVPMVNDMLKNAGIGIDEIDLFAVSAGPGSFTGVRIGGAAVKGVAFASEKPCVGVSTLAAMARAVQGLPLDGIICAAMDARCGQVYTALFEIENGKIRRLMDDTALSIEELKNHVELCKKNIILIGDGAELCYNAFGASVKACPAPANLRYQNAVGVAMEAESMLDKSVSADQLMPVYLRLPQAERELKRRLGQID